MRTSLLYFSGLLLLLALATWSYAPGLSGGFVFDDYANLPALGATGPVDDAATFWRYITSGTADPTGRPIALLSFLLDAQDWPADPLPFKRTNLVLHLLNTLLLATVLRKLTALAPGLSEHQKAAVALWGTALWALHPLLVSTTLYVVQREAMLPAAFVLLGLLSWLRGRSELFAGRRALALAWMLIGMGLCTTLATLSKANGVLLPMLAGVLELTVLRQWQPMPAPQLHFHKQVCRILLALPALLVISYLVHIGIQLAGADISRTRAWTMGERLLTQPRVLLDYIALLIVPRPFTSGLFNDTFVLSRGWMTPATTGPALTLVLALIAGAFALRQRQPALAAGVLFFFAAQLMESTTIPLEPYFEHRNYLPAMLLFWPLGLALAHRCNVSDPKRRPTSQQRNTLALALAAGACMTLAAMTHARASLWGNQTEQALVWAALNPTSPRAQAYAARAEMQLGHTAKAISRLDQALKQHSSQLQLAVTLVDAHCQLRGLPESAAQLIETAFATTRNPGRLLTSWAGSAIPLAESGRCKGFDLPTLSRFLGAAENNPQLARIEGQRQDMASLRGLVALSRNDGATAAAEFTRTLQMKPEPQIALRHAAQLGASGYPALGIALLDEWARLDQHPAPTRYRMSTVHAWILEQQQYWSLEVKHLRETLQADIKQQPSPIAP